MVGLGGARKLAVNPLHVRRSMLFLTVSKFTVEASMRGKVKWFSLANGYGFITDEQSRDHYFSVQDVRGAELPAPGDLVQFQSKHTNRGLRASGVQLVSRSSGGRRGDDRVECTSCGRKMVPRIITYQGVVDRSVCPFCTETYVSFVSSSGSRWRWVALATIVLIIFVSC